MRRNKIILAFLLSLLLIIIPGCLKDQKNKSADIIAVNFPAYDAVRALIQGTSLEVRMLLPPGSESHSYEPSSEDIIAILDSRLFVYTGGESDAWVDAILNDVKAHGAVFSLMEATSPVLEERSEGMEGEAEEEAEYDEHVWTSLVNEEAIIWELSATLAQLYPTYTEAFAQNRDAYIAQLADLESQFAAVVREKKRDVLLFADRFPLRYFVDEFSLRYYAAFPGCVAQSEPSAKTVAFLMDKVREEHIPVVLHLELSNTLLASRIAADTGVKMLEWNSCHNVSKRQFDDGVTYIDLMKKNIPVLKEALL